MNKLYSLKYNEISDLFLDKIKEDTFDLNRNEGEELIKVFINEDYDIKANGYLIITRKDNLVVIYFNKNHSKILMCILDDTLTMSFTEMGKELYSNEEMQKVLFINIIILIKYINKIRSLNNKEVKMIKGKYFNKIIEKKSRIEIIEYAETPLNKKAIINKKDNVVEIISNDFDRKLYKIPAPLYPMPNNSEVKVFTSENTEEIDTDLISDILSGELYKSGYCYTNSDFIIDKLEKANIGHKIEFYCGWLLSMFHPIHHAWVVIDDKYVIDAGLLKDNSYAEQCINDRENGISSNFKKINIAMETVNILKSEKPFKDKFTYGKVSKDYDIYVGVKSNSLEARISFNELMSKYPNHPNYRNLNSNWSNETLDMIHSRI